MEPDPALVERKWFAVFAQFGWYASVWWGAAGRGGQTDETTCRERQDGQTTLGPQSFWETISVSLELRHRRARNPIQEDVPQVKLWPKREHHTLYTSVFPADAKREQWYHARNPKHSLPLHLLLFPCQGKREVSRRGKRDREPHQETERQRRVKLYLDSTLSPSVSLPRIIPMLGKYRDLAERSENHGCVHWARGESVYVLNHPHMHTPWDIIKQWAKIFISTSSKLWPDEGERQSRGKHWYHFPKYQTLRPPKRPVINITALRPYGMRHMQNELPGCSIQ